MTFSYPGDKAADLAVKDRVWSNLTSALAGLETMITKWRKVEVEAVSRDKRIRFTIDNAGHLTSLTLADDVPSVYSGEEFTAQFNTMIEQAAAAAAEQHHRIGGTDQAAIAAAIAKFDPSNEVWL